MVHRLRRQLRRLSSSNSSTVEKRSTKTHRAELRQEQIPENSSSSFTGNDSILLSRPTLVRRMTSGTLGGDDSIRLDEHHHRHSLANIPFEMEAKVEVDKDTYIEMEDSDQHSIQVRKLPKEEVEEEEDPKVKVSI